MNPLALHALLLLLLFLAPVADRTESREENRATRTSDDGAVRVAMKNVMYHFTEPISIHIIRLQGTLTPTKPGTVVVFDDKNSFVINLASAEIAISCDAMALVMNQHVFEAQDAPIKNATMSVHENQLIIKGELHDRQGLPFEVAGTLTPEADGRIRFHAQHVKAAHLPVKGLLDLLGLDLAKLINTKKVQGVSADKDDLIFNPEEIFPPPHIRGRVSQVRLEGNDIVQVFGTAPGPSFAEKEAGNYMAYRDSDLRFRKLTMNEADLMLLDMDPQDPFDFFLDHYWEQVVAGYTKTTPGSGLRVYTRDYNKLRNHTVDRGHHKQSR